MKYIVKNHFDLIGELSHIRLILLSLLEVSVDIRNLPVD